MTISRYYIANIGHGPIIAALGDVTIIETVGVFEGVVEPSLMVIVASQDSAKNDKVVAALLAKYGETCALVERGGEGFILYARPIDS